VKPEVQQRLARADELLRAAKDLLCLGYPSDSVSRSYYAMFHAATAVLGEVGIERSSHHAAWAAFGEHVTAKGLLDVRYLNQGLLMFKARSRSDYLAAPKDTPDQAEESLQVATDFVAACRGFLEKGAS